MVEYDLVGEEKCVRNASADHRIPAIPRLKMPRKIPQPKSKRSYSAPLLPIMINYDRETSRFPQQNVPVFALREGQL